MNNYFKTYIRIAVLVSSLASMTSCTDVLTDVTDDNADNGGKGIGEKVLFTVGTTENSTSSRAAGDGKSYYMEDGSRFVCRMYYYAKPGDEHIDVVDGTDFMAWLKVDGNIGNSLYWNKFYEPLQYPDREGYGGHDNLGNDYSADAFYWQNRKKHVFLAMTDLNQAKQDSYKYGIDQGKLKLTPADVSYKIKDETETDEWIPIGYTIQGVDGTFGSWEEVKNYVEANGDNADFKDAQTACDINSCNWDDAKYEYMYGWSCKFSDTYATTTTTPADPEKETPETQTYGPVKYLMYYDTFPYDENDLPADKITVIDDKGKTIAYKDKYGIYLCNVIYKKDADGNETDVVDGLVKTDDYGNTLYDESKPRYTFYYNELKEQHSVIMEHTYNMNAYDLTRGTKGSMSEQPDICQAITEQAPLGATQTSNRVNLYFKHQFSQVQVNLKNASDNSVNIEREQIKKVELLGVTDEAYVCVDLDETGKINHAPIYKPVNASNYTAAQLAENPFGTSFEMFDMYDEDKGEEGNYGYALGYLKSLQCITFGQLQAIRITWQEHDTSLIHTATFRVTETNLQNLQSGVKYIWNMELRRGTLAVIRTEVEDWIVPKDKVNPEDPYTDLEYGTDGTIHD